jgi:hypothetical protein
MSWAVATLLSGKVAEDRKGNIKWKHRSAFYKAFTSYYEIASKISHARNPKCNLTFITDTLRYYGAPIQAVKFFMNACPLVSLTCLVYALALSYQLM